MKELINNNIKFIIAMFITIILGLFGISYALKTSNFDAIGVNINSSNINVNITYDTSANGAVVTSTNKMLPIDDSLVTGINVTDERIVKVKFNVSGVNSNPENTIYDVALHDLDVDCDLRTEDLKWRLYKNGTLLSSGNLSPEFDVINDGRLVLTNTQETLTTSTDTYVFLLWISENCTGNITTCTKDMDQSKYLNKNISGTIKIETSTKTPKALIRKTGTKASCSYEEVNIPYYNTITYNGNNQTLVNDGSNYVLINNTAAEAGNYVVTARINPGYKWSDGTTEDKYINCKINPLVTTITAKDQTVMYTDDNNSTDSLNLSNNIKATMVPLVNSINNSMGTLISNKNIVTDSTAYTVDNLISNHRIDSIMLESDIVDVGDGKIIPTAAKIVDEDNTDVTSNYKIVYKSGKLKINCSNTATAPKFLDKVYTGEEQTGVSGGKNVDIAGTINASDVGKYIVEVTPKKNYCWSDGSTTPKKYNWSIKNESYNITFDANGGTVSPLNKAVEYDEPYGELPIATKANNSFAGWSNTKTTFGYGEFDGTNFYTIDRSYMYTDKISVHIEGHMDNWAEFVPNSSRIISCTQTGGFGLYYNGDAIEWIIYDSGVGYKHATSTKTWASLSSGWHSFDMIFDGNTAKTYIDGRFDCETDAFSSGSIGYNSTNSIFIAAEPDSSPIVPIATGYFKGKIRNVIINNNADLVSNITTIKSDSKVTTKSDHTLYALWSGTKYKITYNANGGSGEPSNQAKDKGVNLTLSSTIPTRTGYKFLGWGTSSSATSATYSAGSTYTSNASATLYAVWKANEATINYKTSGGTLAPETTYEGVTRKWTADSDGFIYSNGTMIKSTYKYEGATNDLSNYNGSYLTITRSGYSVPDGKEWICLSGCTKSDATFDHDAKYGSTDFCDTTKGDCTVVLGVNWVKIQNFDYTGGSQTYTIPTDGTYKLEVWGAAGGQSVMNGADGNRGGRGGYSYGEISLTANTKLYIYVGGAGAKGKVNTATSKGGYNGGGNSYWDGADDEASGGGGGATHIAKRSGLLSALASYKSDILIVAGGGGGAAWNNQAAPSGGGYQGGSVSKTAYNTTLTSAGGTQTSGYAFGQGGNGAKTTYTPGGGGGGGYYGGEGGKFKEVSSSQIIDAIPGASGSGYIGNSSLTNKGMYCYSCSASTATATKTTSTSNTSDTATAKYAKWGNGYARITRVK